ncbi:MAG: hypothetical protein ACTSPO_16020 [Candidatus Heimdallarchaeaceae archaeon]
MTTKGYITSEKKLRALLRDKSHVIRCDKVIHEKYKREYLRICLIPKEKKNDSNFIGKIISLKLFMKVRSDLTDSKGHSIYYYDKQLFELKNNRF